MNEKLPVTVVVPVRNEEANLAECLGRLGRFDEVLVVDSGSTDRTCAIAAECGAQVIQFEWNGQFPKKRNWVLMNLPLRNRWVMFLDADELVPDAFCDELAQAFARDDHAGYWLNYTNHFLGRPLRHGDPQRKLALFRVGQGLFERIEENHWSTLDMEVHEHPIVEGTLGEIATRIDHDDDRGLAKFIDRHKDYALWEARRTLEIRRAPRELWDRLTDRQKKKYANIDRWWFAPSYFLWSYVVRRGFLDGAAGLSYCFYKLWYFWTIRLLIAEQRESSPD